MNKQKLIKLLQDFGIVTNNRLETAIHLALVLPFIVIGLVLYSLLWFLSLNDNSDQITLNNSGPNFEYRYDPDDYGYRDNY